MGKGNKNDKALDLRRRAEKALRKRKPVGPEQLSSEDAHRLIHELEVYQIELEMQNEELRLSQEEIEESRIKYTDLFDFAPVGYFTLDKKGLILEVNLTGAGQLGLERKALMKKTFSRFIHRDDQDKFYLHSKQVIETKTRQTCDIRLKSKDSTEFYAQLVSIADKDSDGSYIQTRTAVTDITDRTKAEEMIRLSEENYARLLESISDGILVLDRQWRYVLVNNALLHMIGKSREELLGHRIMDVFPGVEESQFFKAYKRVIRTGKPEVITDSFTFEDGRKSWFEVHAYPVPEGIFVIASDITERKKSEEELKSRQHLNELLLNSLPYPAMLVSKDKKILLANRNAMEVGATVGGYCWQEFGKCQFIPDDYKKHIAKHGKITASDIHCYFCQADEALDSKLPVRSEVDAWGKIWDTYWIPLDEEIYLHYAADITERKQFETILKARERQQAAVAEFGQHALASSDLPVLMDEAVNLIAQTLNVDYAKILELLPEGNAFLLKAGVGWRKGLVGREIVEAGTNSQCGYTLLTNEPIIVDDLNAETRFAGTSLLIDHRIISGISVIIQGERGPYGTLSAHTTQQHQFINDDINFMLSMANTLAETIKRIRAEERLKESELFALATIDSLSANIAVIDETGKIISVNKAWKNFADANPPVPDNYGVGANYLQICESIEGEGAEEASAFAGAIRAIIHGEIEEYTLEYPCHSFNEKRWFFGRVTRFPGHMSPYVVLAHENITEKKQAEQKITSLSKFPSENPNPVLRIDADGIVLYKNEAVVNLLKAEGLNGNDIYRILPDNVQKLIHKSLKTKKALYDLEVNISDRTYFYSITPVSENNYANLYAIDITERKHLEEQLKAAAITDDLTGLFNRRGFFTLAEQQCKLANRSKRRMLLLYMDLDNMKEINDKLGHVSGDQALRDTAHVIRKTFRDSDIKGRVGGDEFAVLLTDPEPATEKSVVKHFQDNLQAFNVRGNRNYQLSLSTGFSEFDPERPYTIENLVSSADSSMYKNKRKKADKELMTEPRREVKERRLHERLETNDACWVEIGLSDRIRVKNISASGISLTNMHHLMTSRFHSLKIHFHDKTIPVKGVMVWSQLKEAEHYEAGLKFTGLSSKDKNHLGSIISNLSD